MWLAVTACGGATPSAPLTPATQGTTPSSAKVSVFDAPPLADATYVATIGRRDFGHPGPRIAIERGRFQCRRLVELLGRGFDSGMESYRAEAEKTCPPDLAELLREDAGFVLVVDGQGPRWLSPQEVIAAASPIDTPAKALLVVWVSGTYTIGWSDAQGAYGTLEDGLVKQVAGGYEVIASTSERDAECGGARARETVTLYRHTLFVDTAGTITDRGKVVSHRYDVADPCHPLGRRPADFADVASGGTVRGHLLRAMHHEAESVRAFERIARELRAHGAPGELCEAADQAARDERDHAERCARLAGVPVTIARDDLPVRDLLAFAIDNATEGCVGEAYAALASVVQARTAADPALRAHFAAIATDELAHAALAHAIASWLDGVLTPTERAAVQQARAASAARLATSFERPATEAERVLGLPTGPAAAKLLDAVVAASGHADPRGLSDAGA